MTHVTPVLWQQHSWLDRTEPSRWWPLCQRGLAGLALVTLAPLFLLLFVAVRITSRGPFLYRQTRPGYKGDPFQALKIRTMYTGADHCRARALRVDRKDPMITPLGRLLRELKIDELPQLWNVVCGDMALVGPRPISPALQQDMETRIPGFRRRLQVRPGLTSLAQICILDNADNGHMVEDWATRFEAELDYIYHRSPAYDLMIIALTLCFLMRKGWPYIRRVAAVTATLACAAGLSVLATGCADRLATSDFNTDDQAYSKAIRAYGARTKPAIMDIAPVRIPAAESISTDPVYRVGSGDALHINVYGEAGLDDLNVAVDGEGYIQLPFVERVQVAGQSTADIQRDLKARFARQFRDPWVVVNIAEHRSRPIYLLGAFNKPGVVYLSGPTNLLQIVSMGSGLGDQAYLRGARLWRGGEIAPVDLNALLDRGSAAHNAYLQAGDSIYVPRRSDRKAYVLGAVERPGAVPLTSAPMTLLKALTQVGGPQTSAALLSQVRVIRTHSAIEGELILVNARDMLRGTAPDLELQPDDIVYVPDNWLKNWNDVIQAVTPTLQLAGGALQPFVQVKFLKGD